MWQPGNDLPAPTLSLISGVETVTEIIGQQMCCYPGDESAVGSDVLGAL